MSPRGWTVRVTHNGRTYLVPLERIEETPSGWDDLAADGVAIVLPVLLALGALWLLGFIGTGGAR